MNLKQCRKCDVVFKTKAKRAKVCDECSEKSYREGRRKYLERIHKENLDELINIRKGIE